MTLAEHSATTRGRAFLWGGLIFGALLVLVLVTRGFGLLGRGEEPDREATAVTRQGDRIVVPEHSRLRERLKVAPARADMTRSTLSLPGIVESDPAHTFAILSPLPGRVIELRVALGDHVHAGQVLATIDSPDLAQAHEDYDKAADALALASQNLQRQQGQVELGTASTRDLDQARSDRVQAAAEFARAQARLRVLHAPVDQQHRAAYLSVTAPASGSVTTLAVAPAQMINDPTQTLMTVADLSTVWVTALVAEKDLADVAKDQDAQVAFDAYPQQVFTGKVLFVSDVLDPDSRRDKLRIAFANPESALKPNMFATVSLRGSPQSRIVLPASALLMNNDRTTVFVETGPGTFERRVVATRLNEGPTVTVEKGLNAGERVVVEGGILLND